MPTHVRSEYIRAAAGVLTAAAFFIAIDRDTHQPASRPWEGAYVSKKTIAAMPSSIGNGEDLSGREYYEWLRIRNPESGSVPPGIREKELAFARTLPVKGPPLRKGQKGTAGAITWRQRGPHNVGGRTRALGIDIRDPSIMLAGGASGGMWRSVNAGITWEKVAPGDDVQSTTSLVQDRRSGREDTWYYGTGELRGNSASGGGGALYRGDGILKSTDNGLTWTKIPSTSTRNVLFDAHPFDYVWNIALSRTDTVRDMVVAATIGTIQVSTDGGTSWSVALGTILNDGGPRYTDVIGTSTGVFYATLSSKNMVSANTQAVNKGIWRSSDGLTWTNILPPAWPVDYNRVVAAVAPSDENVVYFLAETPGTGATGHVFWKYTYLSGNGAGAGGTWEDRSAFLPNESGLDGNAAFDSQISYDLVVAAHPTNPDVVYIGGVNLYRSTDGGTTPGTWRRIGGYATPATYSRYPANHPDHHALVFHPSNPAILFNGNDGGVYRTNNSLQTTVTWTPLNNGYFTTQFYTIAVDKGTNGDDLIVGGMQDNGTWYTTSFDPFDPWTEVAGGDGAYCQVEPGGNSLYVSFQNGVTYRLTNSGQGRIDPTGGSGYLFINPFILDPADTDRMYMGGGATVWRNTDLSGIPLGSSSPTSVNWTDLTLELSGGLTTSLAASTEPGGTLFVGTSAGRVFRIPQAFQGSPTSTDITGAGFPSGGYVSSIAVDPLNVNHLIVSFSNYGVPSIFATADGGVSWTDVSGNLEEFPNGSGNGPSVRWISILPDSTAYYYFAGTSTGLFSTNALAGQNTLWQLEGEATIGYPVVDMLDVRTSDGFVAVGTHGRGVFAASVDVVKPQPPAPPPVDVPMSFAVSPNYPNPFNAGTAVLVTLPAPGLLTVDVYDISGRVIDRIAEGDFPEGRSAPLLWDGRDRSGLPMPSGIYFIVARSDDFVGVRKAALIR